MHRSSTSMKGYDKVSWPCMFLRTPCLFLHTKEVLVCVESMVKRPRRAVRDFTYSFYMKLPHIMPPLSFTELPHMVGYLEFCARGHGANGRSKKARHMYWMCLRSSCICSTVSSDFTYKRHVQK